MSPSNRRSMQGVLAARIALAAVIVAVATPSGAFALPQQQGSVDLLNGADGQWQGPTEGSGSSTTGSSIAGLPDIFSLGRGAVAIGAPEANPGGRIGAGSVYVVPGEPSTRAFDLTGSLGRGYRIDGAAPGDQLGVSLTSVKLANGDNGLAIGAPYASPNGRGEAGAVYVIDLSRLHANLDLSAGGTSRALVSVIQGAAACAQAGYALGHAPSTGPDHGDALLIGSPGLDPSGCPVDSAGGVSGGNRGAAYAVFARTLAGNLDLATPGPRYSEFVGGASGDRAGASVSGAGVSGTFMIGAPQASPKGRAGAGQVYLIRSVPPRGVASLGAPPVGSTTLQGPAADDATGSALTYTRGFGAGQPRTAVDLVIGAPQGTPRKRLHAGSILIVPAQGLPTTYDLKSVQAPGSKGGQIDGPDTGDQAGSSLAGLGDVNGDGRSDLVIGAPYLNSPTGRDRINNGGAYVLFGGTGSANLDLGRLGSRGYVAYGARDNDQAGTAVAGAENLSGDGRSDVLVGAPFAENTLGPQPAEGGAVFTLWGFGRPSARYPGGTVRASTAKRLVLRPAVQRTGAALFSIAPRLPPGLRINASTGVISGRPRVAAPATNYLVTIDDAAGRGFSRLRLRVTRR